MDVQTSATDDVHNSAATDVQLGSIEERNNGKFPFHFFLLVLLDARYATENSQADLTETNS